MKKNLTELVFILDRSGSMEQSTVITFWRLCCLLIGNPFS